MLALAGCTSDPIVRLEEAPARRIRRARSRVPTNRSLRRAAARSLMSVATSLHLAEAGRSAAASCGLRDILDRAGTHGTGVSKFEISILHLVA